MCKVAKDANVKLDYLKWILNGYVQLQQKWITAPTPSELETIKTHNENLEVSKEELKILFSIISSIHDGVEKLTRQTNQKQFENGLSSSLSISSINDIQEENNTLGK